MDIELVSKDKENGKLSFLAKGIDAPFANTLRRMAIEEVPTLAMEDIEFTENSSALYDEILAHRLGLVPITTDLKSYSLPWECTCKGEGCAKCQLKLTLSTESAGYVYAKEIKSKDPQCKPVYPKMPLVKLFKSPTGAVQQVTFEATARLGQGKEHSKWSPGLVYYKAFPIITIKEKKCEAAALSCPVKVFDVKDGNISINKENHLKCHMCMACVDICPDCVAIEDSKTDFIINIESWGQLEPKEIVTEAMNRFQGKCEEFTNLLKAL